MKADQRTRDDQTETPALRALGLAHYGQHLLDAGRFGSLTEIQTGEGMDLGQVSRIARLAWVGPGIVDGLLAERVSGQEILKIACSSRTE